MISERTTLRDDARWVVSFVLGTAFVYLMLGLLSLAVLLEYEGERIPEATLRAMQSGTTIQLALFVAGGIAWLLWQRRVNLRLRALGREGMRFSPGWTIGWYFIPFANLLVPPQMMQELWQASDPGSDASGWKSSRPTNLVYGWYGSFIVANVISRVGLMSFMSGERTGSLLSDVASALLIVVAGWLAVILIRGIEARLTVLESGAAVVPAHVGMPTAKEGRPRLGLAIAGAAVGALVASGWWVLFANITLVLDLFSNNLVLAYPAAIVFGTVIGYWTMLGTGDRHRMVTIVSGVVTFFAFFGAALVAGGPPLLTVLMDLVTRTGMVLTHLVSMLASPPLLVMAILAVGSAIALTLVKLPIDLWRIGGEKTKGSESSARPAAMRPEPFTAVAEKPSTAPMTPPPASASMPPMTPTSAPVAHTQEPAPAVPALPKDEVSLADRWHSAMGNRGLKIGALAAVLLAVIVGAFLIGRSTSATSEQTLSPPTAPADSAETPVAAPEVAPDAPGTEAIPEDVVTALYSAAARGDLEGARATFAPGFDLDPGALEGWGDPTYEITLVTAGSQEGEIKVEVHENGEGFPNSDVITYGLREETEGWRIFGWFLGAAREDPDIAPQPGAINPQLSRSEQAAVETLSTFLQHRMAGAVADMKRLATTGMPKRQPKVFVMQFGDFTSFEITNVRAVDGGYVVTAKETWGSNNRTYEYALVDQDGKLLVDEQR